MLFTKDIKIQKKIYTLCNILQGVCNDLHIEPKALTPYVEYVIKKAQEIQTIAHRTAIRQRAMPGGPCRTPTDTCMVHNKSKERIDNGKGQKL